TDEMTERRANGAGMTRPELSVLLAYAKRSVFRALLESELPDSDYLEADLARYFPPAIVDGFGHLLGEHPLKREIIATMASNDVVNSQGITFASRMVAEIGAHPADVVRAFRIARDVTGAIARWEEIEKLDGVIDPVVQNDLLSGVDWLENQLEALPAGTRWQRWARQSMEDDLFSLRRSLCERALELAGGAPIDEAIDSFLASREEAVARLQRFLRSLGIEGVTDLS